MTPGTGGHILRVTTLVVAAAAAACGSPAASPAATVEARADWVVFTSDPGHFQVTLPPWLIGPGSPDVPHSEPVLWANEPLAPGETAASTLRIELRVNGPGFAAPSESQDLPTWLRSMHQSETAGVPVITRVLLPAGSAVRLEQVNLRGAPEAQHLLAFVIETSSGLAYLQIHGYEFAWHGRAADIELIAQGLRFR